MIIYLRDYFFFPIASLPYPTYRCTAYASNVNGIRQQCRWHTPAMSMAYASNVGGKCRVCCDALHDKSAKSVCGGTSCSARTSQWPSCVPLSYTIYVGTLKWSTRKQKDTSDSVRIWAGTLTARLPMQRFATLHTLCIMSI